MENTGKIVAAGVGGVVVGGLLGYAMRPKPVTLQIQAPSRGLGSGQFGADVNIYDVSAAREGGGATTQQWYEDNVSWSRDNPDVGLEIEQIVPVGVSLEWEWWQIIWLCVDLYQTAGGSITYRQMQSIGRLGMMTGEDMRVQGDFVTLRVRSPDSRYAASVLTAWYLLTAYNQTAAAWRNVSLGRGSLEERGVYAFDVLAVFNSWYRDALPSRPASVFPAPRLPRFPR